MSNHATKGLHSEVGRLPKVMDCRPGLAQKRLTPANCHGLLFDDVPWVSQARNDHGACTSALGERDVDMPALHDVLALMLAVPVARTWLPDHKLGPDDVDAETATQWRPWLDELPAAKLAEHLVGGVARAEVPFEPAGLLGCFAAPADLLMPPLPDTRFTRDNSCRIGDGVVLCAMFWPARRRESLPMSAISRLQPRFGPTTRVWSGDPDRDHGLATLECGDLMPLGQGVVPIGMGERSAPQGVAELPCEREQWDDGNDLPCCAPGVVMACDRNVCADTLLRKAGIEVTTRPGSEPGRGRGGSPGMRCPIEQDPL